MGELKQRMWRVHKWEHRNRPIRAERSVWFWPTAFPVEIIGWPSVSHRIPASIYLPWHVSHGEMHRGDGGGEVRVRCRGRRLFYGWCLITDGRLPIQPRTYVHSQSRPDSP